MTGSGGASSTPRPIGLITDVSGILDHPPSRVMTVVDKFSNSLTTSLRAKRSNPLRRRKKAGLLRRFAPRNDEKTQFRILAACFARGLPETSRPSKQRAQGMPGARCARSPAGRKKCHASSRRHGHTGLTRHSPRNGFTVSFVLSPVIRIWLTPSSADNSTDLTPTSRRQDHTTSPSASALFVKSASASTASRLTSVTIAKRPSDRAGRNRYIAALPRRSSEISENRKINAMAAGKALLCESAPSARTRM
jgi:hypothetical protein